MALEAVVFQQDPFSFGSKDFYSLGGSGSGPCSYNFGFQQEEEKAYGTEETLAKSRGVDFSATWGSSPSLMVQQQPLKEWDSNSSSPDNGFLTGGFSPAEPPAGAMSCRRKRRRTKSVKNKEEIENQRMTHIAVERNRRRQMNDYLAVLKSMMPTSYVQRVLFPFSRPSISFVLIKFNKSSFLICNMFLLTIEKALLKKEVMVESLFFHRETKHQS